MIELLNYEENSFKGMDEVVIDKDRYTQLRKMVLYLGDRPDHHVRVEQYLEGMCEHHNVFLIGKDKKARLLAKLVNDFDKDYYYYERSEHGKQM